MMMMTRMMTKLTMDDGGDWRIIYQAMSGISIPWPGP